MTRGFTCVKIKIPVLPCYSAPGSDRKNENELKSCQNSWTNVNVSPYYTCLPMRKGTGAFIDY